MAFNVPINSIAPYPTPSDWVRPSDWIAITDTANEVQFLVADTGAKAFTITTTFTRTTGNIYIDWGDGVINTITTTTSTDTSHVYSTGGTACSRGYNTFKIRIYGDATCVITNAQHIANVAVTGGNFFYNVGLLEAYFGDNTCNTSAFAANYFFSSSFSGKGTFQLLEYVKLPATVAWTTQMANMFSNCYNLYKVIMPTSASALTTVNNVFNQCANLRDIILPSNATNITTLASAFATCTNLRTISFPTTLNSCTTLNSTFGACVSLKNITLPSINLVTDLLSAFANSISIQWIKFTSLPSPAIGTTQISWQTTFSGCTSLQNVFFPASVSGGYQYLLQTFLNCVNLKNITFPTGFSANNMNATFSGCSSITNVIFQSNAAGPTSISSTFQNCYLLKSVTLPTTISANTSLINMFTNCTALESITIPSAWTVNSLSGTFSGCINLKSINISGATSVNSMSSMCLNCYKLETITMPASLTALTTLGNAFQNCYRLTSLTFPATMNAVTTMLSAFYNCYNLTSITLPTSTTACTQFNNTFYNCVSLKSITMPATVSASLTDMSGLVYNCFGLTTLTLPTTQTTSLNTLLNFISSAANLTTINNLNKLGSLTAIPLVNGGANTFASSLTSLSFSCPFSVLTLNGVFNVIHKLNSLRLLNTGTGQWTGTSPQINISYCDMSTAALNTLFADIAAQGTVTAKTINITGCTGAAGLTAGDRLVLTSIGWTITG